MKIWAKMVRFRRYILESLGYGDDLDAGVVWGSSVKLFRV